MHRLAFVYLAGFAALWSSPPPSATTATYKYIKTEKQISLSSREITLRDGRTTRELKAEFEVKASPEQFVKLLKDNKITRHWMKGIEDYKVISCDAGGNWKAYVQYNIPWPLSNQDCVISYSATPSANGISCTIKMNGLPNHIPKKEGIERISHLSGCWIVTRITATTSKVVYTIYSEQKSKFPRWATDPIIQQNLIESLAALKAVSHQLSAVS